MHMTAHFLKTKVGEMRMEKKRIVLGISGGIAAYKCAQLVRCFVKENIDVTCVMTESAKQFVTPMTLGILSKNPVYDDAALANEITRPLHIVLAQQYDAIVVAPATGNIMAKAACGIADDLLSSVLLAAKVPVAFAPAMNEVMWTNPATQENVAKLISRGHTMIGPADGDLACGVMGTGRMCEPEEIFERTMQLLGKSGAAAGKRILVTAGPTREAIDPVRFISNRSSGKMGYAIARAAARLGADVTLVTGPCAIEPPVGVRVLKVESTTQMLDAALSVYDDIDIVFKAAAPADYTPTETYDQKLHKKDDLSIEMISTPDVLGTLGGKKTHQFLVGFAAGTYDCMEHALGKMERKNLDMMVLNDVTRPGAGFDVATNIVTVITDEGACEWPMMSKDDVAERLVLQALEEAAKR